MKPAHNHQKPCTHKVGSTTTKQSQKQQKNPQSRQHRSQAVTTTAKKSQPCLN